MAGRSIVCLGDPMMTPGGAPRGNIIESGQELWPNKFKVNGLEVAVEGAKSKWGANPKRNLVPTVLKTFSNGKKIIVAGDPHDGPGTAVATPPDRSVYVE